MSVALGVLLGAGLVLIVSPRLWPRPPRMTRSRARMREWLARAGLSRVQPAVFVVVSVGVGLAVGAVVAAVLPVVAVALVAAAAAALTPTAVVAARGRRRARTLREAWPDLVDHLVAAIRAGRSLGDALAGLAEVGPTDLRGAFDGFGRTFAATGRLGVALDELKERLADPVADRVLETVRMAREVGGTELPAVLRALSAGLRADAAVRSEVEARQSWVVNAARLGVAAPWIVLALLSSRPEAAQAYNSPTGVALLAIGAGVTVVAYRLMIAIGRLPTERRWFA